MRRIIDDNVIYIQDEYNFNMYVLHPQTKEFLYELMISKTDDYHIGCEINEEQQCKEKKQQIPILDDNLFYQGFMSFMENERQITIQDDLGYNRYKKQVEIEKGSEGILLLFSYEQEDILNRFGIHIINITYDGRSLIDQQGKDTKKRLFMLCNELFNTFKEYESEYDGPVLKKVKK